jgi:hypothetical protein
VALSSALLAGLAAIASLMAGHHANEAMLLQIESSDQWSYYQAKSIKQAQLATKTDLLLALGKPPAQSDEEKLSQYDTEKEEIQKKAEELKKESHSHLQIHQTLAAGVTMFQIAIAVGAIAVLIHRRVFWLGSLLVGAVGILFLIQAFLLTGHH